MFLNLTISTKIIAGNLLFLLIVVVLLVFVEISLSGTSKISESQQVYIKEQVDAIKQQKDLQLLQRNELDKISQVDEVYKEFVFVRSEFKRISDSTSGQELLAQSLSRLTIYLDKLAVLDEVFSKQLRGRINNYYNTLLARTEVVDEEQASIDELIALENSIQQLCSHYEMKGHKVLTALNEQLSTLNSRLKVSAEKLDIAANKVADKNTELLSVVLVILLIFTFLSGFYSYYMRRAVCRPLDRLCTTVESIQKNSDLAMRFDSDSKDEIGATGAAFNKMMEQFLDIVSLVKKACDELEAAISQLASLMQEVNEGVSSQRSSTDLVATAINQMALNVQVVVAHTQKASDSTEDAINVSSKGRQVVEVSLENSLSLSNLICDANKAIMRVEKDSSSIGGILDVIRGISEQTNLLALNAAIEAARAGESGRGFAVVADEVRTLAQRTQESTEEIDKMICNLQSGSQMAVALMAKGNEDAERAATQAKIAGESLKTIEQKVVEINELNNQIETSTGEQSIVADEINGNVLNIREVCTTTSKAVEQTVEASKNLMQLSQNLDKLVERFRS